MNPAFDQLHDASLSLAEARNFLAEAEQLPPREGRALLGLAEDAIRDAQTRAERAFQSIERQIYDPQPA